MLITRLELQNFRNYAQQQLEFGKGANVIYGNNAQGKTNLIEALYLFAFGRSFRTGQDKELIRFGADAARLTVHFTDRQRENVIEFIIRSDRKKQIKINGVSISRLGELIGRLSAVLFYPEELNLIKAGPSLRRRFLDIAISQLWPKYYYILSKYNKILLQRNHLIKKIKFQGASADTLPVWNEKLAEYGAELIRYRTTYAGELAQYLSNVHTTLSGEQLILDYRAKITDKADFLQKLEQNFKRELERGATLTGPHRDDFELYINGLDAKVYASQGQQRTCVLSLKIAQADMMFEKLGEYPVLLLDDIMSELDATRRRFLLEKISGRQVILTCTDPESVHNPILRRFYVENGTINLSNHTEIT